MEEKIKDLKKESKEIQKEVNNVYEFAINQVEKNYKRERFIIKILLFIITALLLINGYFAYIFTNTTVAETTETTQEGIYNFTDSKGNVISSDLSLDEMKELIRINGTDKKNNN